MYRKNFNFEFRKNWDWCVYRMQFAIKNIMSISCHVDLLFFAAILSVRNYPCILEETLFLLDVDEITSITLTRWEQSTPPKGLLCLSTETILKTNLGRASFNLKNQEAKHIRRIETYFYENFYKELMMFSYRILILFFIFIWKFKRSFFLFIFFSSSFSRRHSILLRFLFHAINIIIIKSNLLFPNFHSTYLLSNSTHINSRVRTIGKAAATASTSTSTLNLIIDRAKV